MMVWKYTIQTSNGKIITRDPICAEKYRKIGNLIFCKGENNVYKFNH